MLLVDCLEVRVEVSEDELSRDALFMAVRVEVDCRAAVSCASTPLSGPNLPPAVKLSSPYLQHRVVNKLMKYFEYLWRFCNGDGHV